MSRIPALDPSQASPKAQELLAGVKAKIGMVPNMMKTMAHSAAVLDGYLALCGALSTGALPAALREQIALAVGHANSCEYCLSAHSAIGKMVGLSPEDIVASRRGEAANSKTGAILRFARELVVNKGVVDDGQLAVVRSAGVTEAEILETIAHVALNVMTNYINHVAHTDVDFPKVSVQLPA